MKKPLGAEGFTRMHIQRELDNLLKGCTMRSGTGWSMAFSYLKTSRLDFGERIQPFKAMFSRAPLGSGRLLVYGNSVKRKSLIKEVKDVPWFISIKRR
jgi:hypothetical protein